MHAHWFEILHEDADLLVVNKPAGLVCHPTKGDVWSSLISRAREYLGPGSEPRMVNRLDRETSGVVLLAKNQSAAGELGKALEAGAFRKAYLAIVHGHVRPELVHIGQPLGRDDASRVAIKDCVRSDGAAAQTQLRCLNQFHRAEGDFSFVSVEPLTGRKHQIRIHLAWAGHPVVGDKLYGPNEGHYLAFVEHRLTDEARRALILPNHALHARTLEVPWKGEVLRLTANPEPYFLEFLPEPGMADFKLH